MCHFVVGFPAQADAYRALGVAVVAKPHPIMGLAPHVLFVPREGCSLDKRTVLQKLHASLPANHIPRGFTEVAAIPRTGSGKVRRREAEALARHCRGTPY